MCSINHKHPISYDEDERINEPLLTVKLKAKSTRKKNRCYAIFPVRFNLMFWTFTGLFICYALRANLSVAIVAMVKSVDSNTSNPNETTSCFNAKYYNLSYNETKTGEFDWDESTQGLILSSFFYGYILTQLPGGYLAEKYGGKWVFGWGMFITSLATLITPIAARLHISALIGARFVAGLGEGVTFPAYFSLYSHWIPKQERSISLSITNCGAQIGTIVAMPVTAWLCVNGFDGGWPSVFYCFGGAGCFWFLFWAFCVHDKPEKCPCISDKELQYILENRKSYKSSITCKSVPWKDILSSVPVYALATAKFCIMWTYYIMLTELPSYMHSVLNYPIKENGQLNSIVFSAIAVIMIFSGLTADIIRSKNLLPISAIRKIFQSIAHFGPALLLYIITLVGCNVEAVICILISTTALIGFNSGGEGPTALDMSAEFVGILFGITNCLGNIAGLLGPQVTGFITQGNEPLKSWNVVFYLSSVLNIIGGLTFLLFGSAEKQPWSTFPSKKHKGSIPS